MGHVLADIMKMSKTFLAVALLVVLLGVVIREAGAVGRQQFSGHTLSAALARSMQTFCFYNAF